jgi:hypothetical protein
MIFIPQIVLLKSRYQLKRKQYKDLEKLFLDFIDNTLILLLLEIDFKVKNTYLS